MEFFEIADASLTPELIRERVTIDALPDVCDEIDGLDEPEDLGRVVYFLQWGRYHIRRDPVMGGVRFWVPDCPNALAWTVTTGYPPAPDKVVLHATFNRPDHEPEFIEATKALLAAFKQGLERGVDGLPPASEPQARRETAAPLIGDLRRKP
jgi:hypothetical protein